MCNLYSLTRSQDAIRRIFGIARDLSGNLPTMPAIYPDMMAPVVLLADDGARQLEMMRWGFPPPPQIAARPVTNIRNLKSPYWRAWLKPEFRCLVPATSFCEWTDARPKKPYWFALKPEAERPLFAFAGLWRPWAGTRKGESGEHRLFAFLTTEANELVRPVHAKAMPVILDQSDWALWLTGSETEAASLQKPYEGLKMGICLEGARSDAGEVSL